jgi:hypothetical protein
MADSELLSPRSRPHAFPYGAFFWTLAIVLVWSAGLAFLSIVSLGWILGDGIDLFYDLLSVPRLRASQMVWPLSVMVFGVVWALGMIAADRVHRSGKISLGIAICGALVFLAVTMVILTLVPGGNPR